MTSEIEDSVTQWITRIKQGGDGVAQKLWERYYGALVRLARAKLKRSRRAAADEEDVALSAFDSFFAAAAKGRYPQINDRNDLWKLLITITKRKALDQIQSANRLKRGGGKVLREADLAAADGESAGLEDVAGSEPTPEFAAMVAEEYQRLLDALPDPIHRKIAVLRMEGWNDDEIAAQIGCVRRTVGRKLQVIKNTWCAEVGS
jgi:RNA polymerase sigma factor (sigma-70 family)